MFYWLISSGIWQDTRDKLFGSLSARSQQLDAVVGNLADEIPHGENLCLRSRCNAKELCYAMARMDGKRAIITVKLKTVEVEKDLRIYIDPELDFKAHIYQAAAKANGLLGMIYRSFQHMDQDMILNRSTKDKSSPGLWSLYVVSTSRWFVWRYRSNAPEPLHAYA